MEISRFLQGPLIVDTVPLDAIIICQISPSFSPEQVKRELYAEENFRIALEDRMKFVSEDSLMFLNGTSYQIGDSISLNDTISPLSSLGIATQGLLRRIYPLTGEVGISDSMHDERVYINKIKDVIHGTDDYREFYRNGYADNDDGIGLRGFLGLLVLIPAILKVVIVEEFRNIKKQSLSAIIGKLFGISIVGFVIYMIMDYFDASIAIQWFVLAGFGIIGLKYLSDTSEIKPKYQKQPKNKKSKQKKNQNKKHRTNQEEAAIKEARIARKVKKNQEKLKKMKHQQVKTDESLKFCRNCGAKYSENVRFCTNCGNERK